MARKNKLKHKSKHHIKPRSRGGGSNLENIAHVDIRKHQAYHTIFNNKTPDEIIETLVKKYWNGNWDYVRDAYRRHNEDL